MAIKKKNTIPYPIFFRVLLLRAPRRLGLLRSLLLKGLGTKVVLDPPLRLVDDTSEMPFFWRVFFWKIGIDTKVRSMVVLCVMDAFMEVV